jgi:hypothetical protein
MMERMVSRVAVLAATVIVVVGACSSAATPGPTQPPANTSAIPSTATQPPATAIATSVPSAPAATASAALPGLGGTWHGTWTNTTPDKSSGTFVINWTQNGSALSGSIVVKGTPCLGNATITGALDGSAISFGAVSGATNIAYDGTVSGNTMKGTYKAAASCASAKGTWEATKQ